ncbi:hypothetical protein EXIGLDRAFT_638742 [Exidia glandulosa HHB12029]|uniref:Uncharacterized protein n=1 Tax=Exidia glandulosa HHB12029 TaxID=1314781 RepID=A0A165NKS3_EXIGL|nr:hypothetical protein EXIGLDRAFT_638742 [Exidia glandulosa HHB12029]
MRDYTSTAIIRYVAILAVCSRQALKLVSQTHCVTGAGLGVSLGILCGMWQLARSGLVQ